MGFISRLKNGRPVLDTPYLEGLIDSDANAQPSMNVTAGAGSYNALTSSDNTGFFTNDIVQINGSGVSGANDWHQITLIGSGGNPDTTKFNVRQNKPLISAVSAVACQRYYQVATRFISRKVRLINLTTLDRYEWEWGMAQNSCIKFAANGTVTKMTDSGIISLAVGFYFHPSLLGVSSQMGWRVDFDMPT